MVCDDFKLLNLMIEAKTQNLLWKSYLSLRDFMDVCDELGLLSTCSICVQ